MDCYQPVGSDGTDGCSQHSLKECCKPTSSAFLILMLIKKVKFGRNLVKNFDRSWPMRHAGTLVCLKMAEQCLKPKVEAQ